MRTVESGNLHNDWKTVVKCEPYTGTAGCGAKSEVEEKDLERYDDRNTAWRCFYPRLMVKCPCCNNLTCIAEEQLPPILLRRSQRKPSSGPIDTRLRQL